MRRKTLEQELVEKKLADEGMVAWGKSKEKPNFGTIEGANSAKYAVAKAGDQIVFIPCEHGKLLYKNMYAFDASKIKDLQLNGRGFSAKLKMTTVDGYEKIYRISHGKKAVKKIIESLRK